MTDAADDADPATPDDDAPAAPAPRAMPRRWPGIRVAAVASIAAGSIHAAAIGAHAEHPAAARVFAAVAAFQLGWGLLALLRPGRAIAAVGAAGNAALVAGWVLAKRQGISFVGGLDVAEPVQFADGSAAALAEVAVLAAVRALLPRAELRPRPRLGALTVVVLACVAVPGMVEAGRHVHSHGTQSVVVADGKARVVTEPAAVPPKPYDPTLPIDLGGVDGVTPQEQARAENLVAATLYKLPQWADIATAEAAGFRSIGDAPTGYEHYINWSWIDDDHTLDPDYPESLVYRVDGARRVLESAMFMLRPGSTFDDIPDVGGPLTQWHIHDNLCFTSDPDAPQVVNLTNPDGTCPAPLVKLPSVPMIHVWIVAKPCGPFATLEGVGAGQVKPGEKPFCDHVHGSGL